ncbi:MAG: FtsQ-type POTRA domain-containing protein [Gammaproteobacteria bacterium]|nr:FtsQ-type POTRA domain-containing protein [Gammaproteobacteria bacterium]NIR98323.1 FtsQ-type POTRA domain-containing protein [Gammaproteobacteria bacterium]NIT64070.1 FtsQ-type POTRA domain-containing protein [Gammaproteobacteria bacterium]NIV21001.1 FtsQ-type POTRA domain-containing protein [Gammaproteobacteria bacterium]NIX10398.1 FtsQ-type POTRA domain-containing protein [Gammaproteobacteria bacterium]
MAAKRRQHKGRGPWGLRVWLGWIPTAVGAGGLAAGLAGAVWWLMEPSSLPLRSVQVEGSFRHLRSQELQQAVAAHAGGGFFTVDIEAIREAVLQRPWVDTVSVRRIWPDILRIRVTEHRPLARWGDDGLVSVDGVWFRPPRDELARHLPELHGPDGFQRQLVRRYREINGMLRVLGRHVTGLAVNERRAWRMVLDNGVEVRLGRRELESRLRRLVSVYPQVLARRAEGIAAVDLRYTNGFAVRLRKSRGRETEPSAGRSQSDV